MDRRKALKRTALLMGGTLTASTLGVIMNSCESGYEKGEGIHFSESETEMLTRIVDVIIPETDTPGAVAAEVPELIVMMIQDCYPKEDQKTFHEGLSSFDGFCKKQFDHRFSKLSADRQEAAVAEMDRIVLGGESDSLEGLGFYRVLKELTLLGFFTSETGATETLRYVQTPGRYEACEPYEQGDKVWATL